MKTVFLDSSVLFTAVNSPIGGSSKIFTLSRDLLVTSSVVLIEVERNVRKKLLPEQLDRFFRLVGKLSIRSQSPHPSLIKKVTQVIVEKDAVILAEAKTSQTDFLVTLVRRHFLTDMVRKYLSPQRVMTPKDLIQLLEKKSA